MKRVVFLPLSEAAQFPDLEIIARDRNIAAFVGNSAFGRTREAYDSDESFFEAVARGFADRYTFRSLDEAASFAKAKLAALALAAQQIEASLKSDTQRASAQQALREFAQRCGEGAVQAD
ncbi:MAG: hypothetical protein ACJ72H_02940 [Candidatus Sulfotelmatobacter sp.]